MSRKLYVGNLPYEDRGDRAPGALRARGTVETVK